MSTIDTPETIILPPLPDDDPELREYHLRYLTQYWNDFRRVTRSRKKPKKNPAEAGTPAGAELLRDDAAPTEGVAGAESSKPRSAAEEGSTATRPTRRRATPAQLRSRLGVVREWLVQGMNSVRVVHACREQFGVGRRMAQLYVKKAKQGLANEAAREDYLAHLQISRLQHESLLDRVRGALERVGDDPRLLNTLLRTAALFLKRRDELMAGIVEHRAATNRDKSPDARDESAGRRGMIEMPYEEWFERLGNMHYTWRTLWEKEKRLPEFEAQMQAQGYPPSQGKGIRYEMAAQIREHLRQAGQTVDPEILRELDLGDIDILALPEDEPPSHRGTEKKGEHEESEENEE